MSKEDKQKQTSKNISTSADGPSVKNGAFAEIVVKSLMNTSTKPRGFAEKLSNG